jgi:hypothetical protein
MVEAADGLLRHFPRSAPTDPDLAFVHARLASIRGRAVSSPATVGVVDPSSAVGRSGGSGGRSRPIGTLSTQVACTARRVLRSHDQIVFGAEEPISVAYRWRTITLSGGREQGIWRLEVKDLAPASAASDRGEEPPTSSRGRPNDWLVLAEAPYSNCWVGQAAFKRGSQKGGEQRPNVEADSLDDALGLLGALSHDLWEKGRRWTAGFTQPQMPLSSGRAARDPGKNALWVFGVCGDIDAVVEELAGSRVAAELLDVDRVFHPGPNGTAVGDDVHPRVLEERNSLLLIAIKQAMAGPTDQAWDTDAWIGRPVMELAGRIFRDHLYNRTRVERRKDRY